MSIYVSKTWISDIEEVLKGIPELSLLDGKSVLITGSTGLICSALVDLLIFYNENNNAKIKIIAAGRSIEKIKARFAVYSEQDYFCCCRYDTKDRNFDIGRACEADFIIHGASNASPNKIIKEPVETMNSNYIGLLTLLEYAYKVKTERVLFISSSEVYGRKDGEDPFHEDDYGYIDLLSSRNSYSVGKRAAETLCASFTDEFGVDSVIVRPGHIYGPTASKSDNRVSSAWAYDAAHGKDLIMKSDGKQLRSYVYCLDCASAILTVLLKGEAKHAYNISNPASVISICEMAELLAISAGVRLKTDTPSEAEMKGFNPMNNSSLDSRELINLGWKAMFDAPSGFSHTVEILRDLTENKENQ